MRQGDFREALALVREEKAALEVVPGCYLKLQSQYQKWEAVSSVIIDAIGSNYQATTWLFRVENLKRKIMARWLTLGSSFFAPPTNTRSPLNCVSLQANQKYFRS